MDNDEVRYLIIEIILELNIIESRVLFDAAIKLHNDLSYKNRAFKGLSNILL